MMVDIFFHEDVQKLLYNKFVVVIGDSIQRAVYKDLVLILQKDRYLTESNLRNKGELTFEKDELVEGGKLVKMSNGINYREVRQYLSDFHLLRFYFVCRCYNAYVESILADLSEEPRPNVVILNSCLWDISRYGPKAIDEYKDNLVTLFRRFREVLPPDCLVIWNTTLPISKNARGGFIIPEIEFMNSTLRLDILEANYYATQVIVDEGFDVLDLHFYLRYQLHHRADDGIHWDKTAHRRITHILLTHISDAWGIQLPGNMDEGPNQEFQFGINVNCSPALMPAHANMLGNFNMQAIGWGLNMNVGQNMNVEQNMNVGQNMPAIGSSYGNQFPGNVNTNMRQATNMRQDMAYDREKSGSMSYYNDMYQWQPYSNNQGPEPLRRVEVCQSSRYQPYQEGSRRRASNRRVTLLH